MASKIRYGSSSTMSFKLYLVMREKKKKKKKKERAIKPEAKGGMVASLLYCDLY